MKFLLKTLSIILKEAFLLIARTAYNLALFYEDCWGGWVVTGCAGAGWGLEY